MLMRYCELNTYNRIIQLLFLDDYFRFIFATKCKRNNARNFYDASTCEVRSSDDTWISLIDVDTRISRTESLAILVAKLILTLPVFGWILARLGHRSHSPRNAALLYSSLKADICRRAVTRYRGYFFFLARGTRVHAHIVRTCVIRADRYRRRTCGTPRRRLMHFYGG